MAPIAELDPRVNPEEGEPDEEKVEPQISCKVHGNEGERETQYEQEINSGSGNRVL